MPFFHPVLRKHSTKVNLKPNWVICDRDQQLQYAKTTLKDPQFAEQLQDGSLKPKTVVEAISKAKSQGSSPEAMLRQADTPYQKLMAMLYRSVVTHAYYNTAFIAHLSPYLLFLK